MYYYFDTVFLFMGVMPVGSIVSAYTLITMEKEEWKIYADVYLYSTSASNSGPFPMYNFYITLTGSNILLSFPDP